MSFAMTLPVQAAGQASGASSTPYIQQLELARTPQLADSFVLAVRTNRGLFRRYRRERRMDKLVLLVWGFVRVRTGAGYRNRCA